MKLVKQNTVQLVSVVYGTTVRLALKFLFAAAFNPSTDRVLRLGTNFTLTCIDDGNNGNADPSVRFLVGVHVLGTNPQYDNNLRNRGIIWNIDKNNITAVGNISVPASIENNGTVVRCFAGTVITPQQRIIAVEGMVKIVTLKHSLSLLLQVHQALL